MVNHSEENKDFARLKELGFNFNEESSQTQQEASTSRIGGDRGKQEYGIESSDDSELPLIEVLSIVSDESQVEEKELSPEHYIQDAGEPTSEWTESHALHPEQRIAENRDAKLLAEERRSVQPGITKYEP